MALVGQDGVAAYWRHHVYRLCLCRHLFGYAMGSAPLVSYHYGAENHGELTNLFRKSLRLVAGMGAAMTLGRRGAGPSGGGSLHQV